ncbi:hypothetical protein P168DRAFT_303951 [Aspergillus campestris IBT 28561]|uniref:SET domain-containing protein n=1 Tax=Aspergillus campestris (strain IBT 28561) TaxID=1392248 RepID=A0A2I1D4K4_ASPC2|nr:uncharacterized protein P168DRAFT_303951 [Aspergillus campestris IBT 28561]PKY04803.1 hypothetical protein P168DRAFT_303951 [Aspergillus campestris IBT 28561]
MQSLLTTRSETTSRLYADPHNPHLHLERGRVHEQLGFPDLASADAYRALSLLDSVVDPDGCEFHARRVVDQDQKDRDAVSRNSDEDDGEDEDEDDDEGFAPITQDEYDAIIGDVYALLVRSLVSCGCFRDAYDFAVRGLALLGDKSQSTAADVLREQMRNIKSAYRARLGSDAPAPPTTNEDDIQIDPSRLPAQGYARRVLYPWNTHEPDRKAPETLALLNERLKTVAPKCEVRAVALPALHNTPTPTDTKEQGQEQEVSIQLGLFAKEDLHPGEVILRESSLLTATNRLHDDLCDACNAPLPAIDSENPPVPCEECADEDDIFFCSQACHDAAQSAYHGAVCGLMHNLDSIGKDIPDKKDKADYLYLLLLARALAMAATQSLHPLDLPEVKYIWGDFHPYQTDPSTEEQEKQKELPFSFHLSILQPMRFLEEMSLDPYTTLPHYDTWVLNSLYAKFRGTASGRLSTWDGGPELCAVHPLWCLANHSCDPNVRWDWAADICFTVRDGGKGERVVWGEGASSGGGDGGIKKDQEILNHYCDIGMDVKQRREWACGALGGICLCER